MSEKEDDPVEVRNSDGSLTISGLRGNASAEWAPPEPPPLIDPRRERVRKFAPADAMFLSTFSAAHLFAFGAAHIEADYSAEMFGRIDHEDDPLFADQSNARAAIRAALDAGKPFSALQMYLDARGLLHDLRQAARVLTEGAARGALRVDGAREQGGDLGEIRALEFAPGTLLTLDGRLLARRVRIDDPDRIAFTDLLFRRDEVEAIRGAPWLRIGRIGASPTEDAPSSSQLPNAPKNNRSLETWVSAPDTNAAAVARAQAEGEEPSDERVLRKHLASMMKDQNWNAAPGSLDAKRRKAGFKVPQE